MIPQNLPADLKKCVEFHGHLCPGLVYGFLVAAEAARILDISRSEDEEIVAVSENDSCAVDGLQVMLGTTAGKGNLIIKNIGKNAFTVISRTKGRAVRFSRKTDYSYSGDSREEFDYLEQLLASGDAAPEEKRRQKYLKALDLISKNFNDVFSVREVDFKMPEYAPLAPSKACDNCGEMTMSTKMVPGENGQSLCVTCAEELKR